MPKLQPPFYFFLCLIISIILHFIIPIYLLITVPYNYFGLILIIIGSLITVWADWLFKQAKTTVKPGQQSNLLVIKGPYKISRNPMYLGMLMILLGISFILGTLIAFLSPVIFYLIMQFIFIPLEEKMLQQKFNQQFLNYKKQTRRWL